ncbi:MAG: mercury transporter [Firmicutes bacterium HGW-Firmicutes-5]|nr:MAG: mercury transporter [Firmicutes bacterium HGW-Firmicutes-5]
MDLVDEMAVALIMLIRAGAGLRIIYCFISMAGDEEQVATYKKRIKNTIVFYVLAESVYVIRDLVMYYYA